MEQGNLSKPIVFFDLETTGIDVVKDSIIELAMIKVKTVQTLMDIFMHRDNQSKDIENLESLHKFCNPGKPIPPEVIAIHGITDERVAQCPKFAEIAPQEKALVDGCYLCGFNSDRFDTIMLVEEMNRANVPLVIDKSMLLDAYKVEKQLCSRTLIATYKRYYEQDYGSVIGSAHGAKADTIATIAVFAAQFHKLANDANDLDICENYRLSGKPNDKQIDLAGFLAYNDNHEACFTFGKYKGQTVKQNWSYASWMLSSSFPTETKQVIRDILNKG
jgi:DNA polymerase-3 subunit epsilon